ncbi:MAG: sigma-70 family RNA polymerase sigma factor [Candidatus Eisenbacteria bacterium]
MDRSPDPTQLTDDELVRRAQTDPEGPAGRAAASVLLGRYQERVFVWCYRHLRDREKSLEVSQDVLMRAYKHLGTFKAEGAFGAWIFTITRNRCRSALRLPAWLRDESIDPDMIESERPSPEEVEVQATTMEQLMGLIETRLEPLEQEALWLRCGEGMPVDEITRTLRIEERSGARSVLQRARRKLRAELTSRNRGPDAEFPRAMSRPIQAGVSREEGLQ